MKTIDPKERLILALDVPTIEEAKSWVETFDGLISFFKIGLQLQILAGLDLVKWLISKNKKVFIDYKYYDIEETVRLAVANVAELGVDFLTVHGNGKIIKAAAEGRGKSNLKIFSVTVLTCLDAFDLKEFGFNCSVEELVLHRAKKSLEAGCDGVIASGHEVKGIRKFAQNKLLIGTPGIRPEWANTDDHKRHTTHIQAIESGSDYLIMGRPIRNAKNPRKAVEQILCEMQSAFEKQNDKI